MVLPRMNELSNLKCEIDKLSNRISIRIDDEESDDDSPTPSLAATAVPPVNIRSNLKLSLPKFSGKVEDWPRWSMEVIVMGLVGECHLKTHL